MSTVLTKSFPQRETDLKEVLRYAGVGGDGIAEETLRLAEECIRLCSGRLRHDVCYAEFSVKITGDLCDLGFAIYKSESLARYLAECGKIVVFAATVGLELDRLIAGFGNTAPSRAHMLQAVGAERIESLCDSFCGFVRSEYGDTRHRFSPGYGDFPLEAQKDIFRVLDPSRRIGLSLSDTLLMSPTKSVTAIVGVKREKESKSEK